ncbi:hsp72-like protein [Apiospora hydei]|uniref:Hsp72-like protein n=1 Tax=Apiospora hydei TaxID=1337664 RepID=A0ABR1W7J9_9PEZI
MTTYGVGIDIGTANTRVAVYRNDSFELIPDEEGMFSMPSYVSFGDRQRHIGATAKRQANKNPENTVFNVLRLIGRDFKDPTLQDDLNYLPFKSATWGRKCALPPEEVLAMILAKTKQNAETYLDATVKEVLLSVPADFGIRKYDAVRNAAAIAGLEVLDLHPSSVCASYVLGITRPEEEITYVMADMGAGGFNFSVVTSEESIHEVLGSGTGGEDVVKLLVRYFADEIRSSWYKDITKNKRAFQRLRGACEKAVCDLSSAQATEVHLESLVDGRDFVHRFTRQDFESISFLLFEGMRQVLDRALEDARITKSKVNYVFALGGCSRIPQVQNVLSDYFENKELDRFLDAEEAQVCGLAVGAAIKTDKQPNTRTIESLLLSVVPRSLGIETHSGRVQKILPKNSTTPTKGQATLSLSLTDFDPGISYNANGGKMKPDGDLAPGTRTLRFYEGEGAYTSSNELVGTLPLDAILPPPGPEMISLEVRLDVTSDTRVTGTVKVAGTVAYEKKMKEISISLGNHMPAQRLQQSITNEAYYRRADEKEAQRLAQRVELDQQISSMSEMCAVDGNLESRRPGLSFTIQSMRSWLEANEDATLNNYRAKLQELRDIQRKLQNGGTQAHTSRPSSAGDPPPQYQEEPNTASRTSVPLHVKGEVQEMIDWLDAVRTEFDVRHRKLQATLEAFQNMTNDERAARHGSGGAQGSSARPYQPPPTRDPAEVFESHFDGTKTCYTTADLQMISTWLRVQGQEEQSRNPKLYTVLRLVDGLDMFVQFIRHGISDASFPLDLKSLPSSIELEIALKFFDQQAVVTSGQ